MTRTWRGLSVPGIAALLALQLLDLATTFYGLAHGAREVGPIAAPLGAGTLVLLAVPFIGMGLQLAAIALLPPRARPVGWAVVLAVTGYLVAGNLAVIASL